ncbi:MAG TPA: hypothetical protein VNN08_24315 [Thermoanaerobaculia bacterium]|nr:hypothetical protein [Thermoanaerobaculia bacterium]
MLLIVSPAILFAGGLARKADKPANVDPQTCIKHLSTAVATFYGGTSLPSETTRAALRAMIADYNDHLFDCDEIARILRSMRHLVETRTAPPAMTALKEREVPYPAAREDTMFVWVNPTCPHCRDAVRKVIAYQRANLDAPAVVFRLLPAADDEVSQYAAISLEVFRRRQPDLFASIVIEMLERLPGDVPSVDSEMTTALGGIRAMDLPEYESARQHIKTEQQGLATSNGAPIIVFRGRTFEADNFGGLAFDPLHDPASLSATVRAIRDSDNAEKRRLK